MAAPVLDRLIPMEDYLRTSYEPECEYIDGVLLSKDMPKNNHSLLQFLLMVQLAAQQLRLGLSIRPELRVAVGAGRVRVPDIAVFEGPLREQIPTRAPAVTIEILSDSESFSALTAKVRDHLASGVKLVIIPDPTDKTVMIADAAGLRSIQSPQIVRVQLKKGELAIDFDNLFAQMEAELNAPDEA